MESDIACADLEEALKSIIQIASLYSTDFVEGTFARHCKKIPKTASRVEHIVALCTYLVSRLTRILVKDELIDDLYRITLPLMPRMTSILITEISRGLQFGEISAEQHKSRLISLRNHIRLEDIHIDGMDLSAGWGLLKLATTLHKYGIMDEKVGKGAVTQFINANGVQGGEKCMLIDVCWQYDMTEEAKELELQVKATDRAGSQMSVPQSMTAGKAVSSEQVLRSGLYHTRGDALPRLFHLHCGPHLAHPDHRISSCIEEHLAAYGAQSVPPSKLHTMLKAAEQHNLPIFRLLKRLVKR